MYTNNRKYKCTKIRMNGKTASSLPGRSSGRLGANPSRCHQRDFLPPPPLAAAGKASPGKALAARRRRGLFLLPLGKVRRGPTTSAGARAEVTRVGAAPAHRGWTARICARHVSEEHCGAVAARGGAFRAGGADVLHGRWPARGYGGSGGREVL